MLVVASSVRVLKVSALLAAILALGCSGCSATPSVPVGLKIIVGGSSSLTVRSIADGQPFVASGLIACVDGGDSVTLTSIAPLSNDASAMRVTAFDTLIATPGPDNPIPIGLRGALQTIKAKSASKRVEMPCSDTGTAGPVTYLAWQVTGGKSGHSANGFVVHYTRPDGTTGTTTVPVRITLCTPGDVEGSCKV